MTIQKPTLEKRIRTVREHLEDGKSFSELSVWYGRNSPGGTKLGEAVSAALGPDLILSANLNR